MKKIFLAPLFKLLILGLLLRISLLFLDYSFDVNNHITWAKDLWARGFAGFYEARSSEVFATAYPNYPPLPLFIFYLIYPIQTIIFKVLWFLNISLPIFPSKLIFLVQDRSFLAAVFKIPAIIADLGLAVLCFRIAKKLVPRKPPLHFLAAYLVIFNPAFFFNSAYWGQIDVMPLFFSLLSFYFLFFTNKYLRSGTLFVLALLIKPTVLVFAPLYALAFIKKFNIVAFIKAFIFSSTVFWIAFLPFLGNGVSFFSPFNIYIEKILSTQSLPYVTNGAFNFWVLVTYFEGIKDTVPFILGLSYRLWGYGLVAIFLLLIIYFLIKKIKIKPSDIFYATAIIALASFLFLTKMHERYSMLPLPFLLLASTSNRKLLPWFILLSILSFLNLYHSWPVPRMAFLVSFLYNPAGVILLTVINMGVFFYLLRGFFQVNIVNRSG